MVSNSDICLVTPTWAPDLSHFELLRTSLDSSALANVRHHVVVQTEDLATFSVYRHHPGINLLSSQDVLPDEVEKNRMHARQWRGQYGRTATRWLTSMTCRIGWPEWVRYTGWHTQQLIKLCMAVASDAEHVMILDSDVIVTKHARIDDYIAPGKVVCLGKQGTVEDTHNKVYRWNRQADKLWGLSSTPGPMETYFDTPFLLHAPTIRQMLKDLESIHQKTWWQVLLQQPPRRWSEFATYLKYLRQVRTDLDIDWHTNFLCRYIFDASDPEKLAGEFSSLLEDASSHYITIHSQNSGRQLWQADAYIKQVKQLLQ